MTGMRSCTICFAAVATAISPEAHIRSIVIPATLTGSPAAATVSRATL